MRTNSMRNNNAEIASKRMKKKISKQLKTKRNSRALDILSSSFIPEEARQQLRNFVLKLLGDETIEDIDGFVEEWEYFQDLDLIVLGSSFDEYKEYADLLREEYSKMNIENYNSMRSKATESDLNISSRPGVLKKRISRGEKRRQKRLQSKMKRNSIHRLLRSNTANRFNNLETEFTAQFSSDEDTGNVSDTDCVIVEPLKDTVIYIDCDDIDDTISIGSANNKVLKQKDDTLEDVSDSEEEENTILEEGEIQSDYDRTLVTIDETIVPKFDAAVTIDPSPNVDMTLEEGEIRDGENSDESMVNEQIENILQIVESKTETNKSPKRTPKKQLFVIDTLGGISPISSIPMYNYDKDSSRITINDTFDLTTIEDDINDSVIFCGEYMNTESTATPKRKPEDFISINLTGDPNYNNTNNSNKKRRKLMQQSPKLNRLESSTGKNFYNPNKIVPAKNQKRMVIIDGSNVAYGHANNRFFSAEGLEICLRFFEKKGHETKAIVPQHRMQLNQTSNQGLMDKMHKQGAIILTPSKRLPGKNSSCYDDRFILQCAKEFDGAIISNDNYRDLLQEFKFLVENRVIGYTWFKDMIIIPEDPYGRVGPNLSQILTRE